MKTYTEKLQDPRWQKKRLNILKKAGWKCSHCGDMENALHVHHTYYKKNTDPWDYEDDAYCVFCKDCHEKAWEYTTTANWLTGDDLNLLSQVMGYAVAHQLFTGKRKSMRIKNCSEAVATGISRYCTSRYAEEAIIESIEENDGWVDKDMINTIFYNKPRCFDCLRRNHDDKKFKGPLPGPPIYL